MQDRIEQEHKQKEEKIKKQEKQNEREQNIQKMKTFFKANYYEKQIDVQEKIIALCKNQSGIILQGVNINKTLNNFPHLLKQIQQDTCIKNGKKMKLNINKVNVGIQQQDEFLKEDLMLEQKSNMKQFCDFQKNNSEFNSQLNQNSVCLYQDNNENIIQMRDDKNIQLENNIILNQLYTPSQSTQATNFNTQMNGFFKTLGQNQSNIKKIVSQQLSPRMDVANYKLKDQTNDSSKNKNRKKRQIQKSSLKKNQKSQYLDQIQKNKQVKNNQSISSSSLLSQQTPMFKADGKSIYKNIKNSNKGDEKELIQQKSQTSNMLTFESSQTPRKKSQRNYIKQIQDKNIFKKKLYEQNQQIQRKDIRKNIQPLQIDRLNTNVELFKKQNSTQTQTIQQYNLSQSKCFTGPDFTDVSENSNITFLRKFNYKLGQKEKMERKQQEQDLIPIQMLQGKQIIDVSKQPYQQNIKKEKFNEKVQIEKNNFNSNYISQLKYLNKLSNSKSLYSIINPTQFQ
ncbi:hypothetical protein PPERSA_11326 [Pseudocohnilembus persalinus]|uniref:Uncharacterized protein n=1 Tax=Pseudocohnilembus persalinus TaxID=266149 RepID=A0A0V0QQA1_PSEPJ|nr:hypothetical protein PPERSA_11326 [Pseudocohnilembus persalinus]|eukprot:KRX04202.1 hypothetical protein PPERSA_11326 [Pseudocohnilembus persalinus]